MSGKLVTVSAKVPKELKKELEKRGIKMSDAIRRGLERELKDRKIHEIESMLEKADFSKVTEEDIVRHIRETREEN